MHHIGSDLLDTDLPAVNSAARIGPTLLQVLRKTHATQQETKEEVKQLRQLVGEMVKVVKRSRDGEEEEVSKPPQLRESNVQHVANLLTPGFVASLYAAAVSPRGVEGNPLSSPVTPFGAGDNDLAAERENYRKNAFRAE